MMNVHATLQPQTVPDFACGSILFNVSAMIHPFQSNESQPD
jgi:hypothetical protein